MPVAWMLSSNTKSETITYFLFLVQFWNPDVWPTQFMTDCDQAQISALQAVYPQTKVLLCNISNLLNDLECTGCTGASTPVHQFHNWHQFDSVLDSGGRLDPGCFQCLYSCFQGSYRQ